MKMKIAPDIKDIVFTQIFSLLNIKSMVTKYSEVPIIRG